MEAQEASARRLEEAEATNKELLEAQEASARRLEEQAASWAANAAALELKVADKHKQAAGELDRASTAYDLVNAEKEATAAAMTGLRAELDAAHAHLDGLQTEVRGSQESIAALNREKDELVRANMELEASSSDRSEEGADALKSLQDKVIELMHSVQEKDQELMAGRVVAAELDGKLEAQKKNFAELQKTHASELEAQRETGSRELQQCVTEWEGKLAAQSEAGSRELQQCVTEWEGKVAAQSEAGSRELQQCVTEWEGNLEAQHETGSRELQQCVTEWEGKLAAQSEAGSRELQQCVTGWEGKLAAAHSSEEALRAELSQMEEGLERASEALDESHGEKETLEAQRAADQEMIASLTAAADAFEASNLKASGSNSELNAKISALEQELSSSEAARVATVADLEAQRSEAANSTAELAGAVDKATAEAESSAERLHKAEAELNEHRARVLALEVSAAQLQNELTEAHEQLQQQQRAAQQAVSSVSASQEKESSTAAEMSNLREKVQLLENRNRAAIKAHEKGLADLRAELEEQVQSLSNDVEMLTLDKEQLSIDLEMAQEEKDLQEALNAELTQAQAQMEAERAAGGASGLRTGGDDEDDGASPSATAAQLLEDNGKLKEAILKLHTQMNAEVEGYRLQLSASEDDLRGYEEARTRLVELDKYKIRSEEAIDELQQAVEASRDYEGMIENLTEQNLELRGHNEELSLTVSDLEMAQELNEELDATQRGQLTAAQEDLDILERRLIEARDESAGLAAQLKHSHDSLAKYKKIVEDLKQNVDEKSQRLIDDSLVALEANELSREVLHLRQSSERCAAKARALKMDLSLSQIQLAGRELRYKRLELCGLPASGSAQGSDDALTAATEALRGLSLGGKSTVVGSLFAREVAYAHVEQTMCQAISKANVALQCFTADPAVALCGTGGESLSAMAVQSALQGLYNGSVIRANLMQAVYRCVLLFGEVIFLPNGVLSGARGATSRRPEEGPISSAAELEALKDTDATVDGADAGVGGALDTDRAATVVAVHRKLDEWADVLLASTVEGGPNGGGGEAQEDSIFGGQGGLSSLAESTVNITQNHIIKQAVGLLSGVEGTADVGSAVPDVEAELGFEVWREQLTLSFVLRLVHMHCFSCGQMLALCRPPPPSEEVDEWGDSVDAAGGAWEEVRQLGEGLNDLLGSCTALLGSEVGAQRAAAAGGDAKATRGVLGVLDRANMEDLLAACDLMLTSTHSLALSAGASNSGSGEEEEPSGLATTNSSIASSIVCSLVKDIQSHAMGPISNVLHRIAGIANEVLLAASSAETSSALASPMRSPMHGASGGTPLFPDFFHEQFVWSYLNTHTTGVRSAHVAVVVVLPGSGPSPDSCCALRMLTPSFRRRSQELRGRLEACLAAEQEHQTLKAEHRALQSDHFRATNTLEVTTGKVVELSGLLASCEERRAQLETQLRDVARDAQDGGGGGEGSAALRRQLEECRHENVVLEEAISILEARIEGLEKEKKSGARGDKDTTGAGAGGVNNNVFELISRQNRLYARMLAKPTPALGAGAHHPLTGASIAQLRSLVTLPSSIAATPGLSTGNPRQLFQ